MKSARGNEERQTILDGSDRDARPFFRIRVVAANVKVTGLVADAESRCDADRESAAATGAEFRRGVLILPTRRDARGEDVVREPRQRDRLVPSQDTDHAPRRRRPALPLPLLLASHGYRDPILRRDRNAGILRVRPTQRRKERGIARLRPIDARQLR